MTDETALSDLRILDLSTSVAGSYCTQLLAGHGADVIVVEPPSGHALRATGAFEGLTANKRSVTLDIRTELGQRVFRQMVEQANIVVETFAPGVLDSLGIGYESLLAIKRRTILCSITGSADPDAELFAGLNAFSAIAIASYASDAWELPQHIEINVAECVAAAASMGELRAPEYPPFAHSDIPLIGGAAPTPGQHNLDVYAEEIQLDPDDIAALRAEGIL